MTSCKRLKKMGGQCAHRPPVEAIFHTCWTLERMDRASVSVSLYCGVSTFGVSCDCRRALLLPSSLASVLIHATVWMPLETQPLAASGTPGRPGRRGRRARPGGQFMLAVDKRQPRR